jgi:hypothetical protein
LQAGGQVGSYITHALLATGKHNLTAITRAESNSVLPDGVIRRNVDYNDHESIVSALRGHDFLVISMSVFAPDAQPKLIAAAKDAGVKWIMPNEYGIDYEKFSKTGEDTKLGPPAVAIRQSIRAAGLNFVSLACSFWYEFSLAGTSARYGFDFAKREVTFFDDGETKITTSTWLQCGRALAALLSLPVYPLNEQDQQLTLSHFRDRSASIGSFHVSQKDMFESVLRVTETKEADWKISYEGAEARYKRGGELFAQGDFGGYAMMLYARSFYKDSPADLQAILENEKLGLPKEDFDEATKRAAEMAKNTSETTSEKV